MLRLAPTAALGGQRRFDAGPVPSATCPRESVLPIQLRLDFPLVLRVMREGLFTGPGTMRHGSVLSGPIFSEATNRGPSGSQPQLVELFGYIEGIGLGFVRSIARGEMGLDHNLCFLLARLCRGGGQRVARLPLCVAATIVAFPEDPPIGAGPYHGSCCGRSGSEAVVAAEDEEVGLLSQHALLEKSLAQCSRTPRDRGCRPKTPSIRP
jgi:hypothetical protein